MKRILQFCAAVWLLSLLLLTNTVNADVNDFVVNDLTADYYLSKDDPQGQMRVVERIDLTFSDNNHGVLRAIPTSYKDTSLNLSISKISSETNAPAGYTTYSENGNLVL